MQKNKHHYLNQSHKIWSTWPLYMPILLIKWGDDKMYIVILFLHYFFNITISTFTSVPIVWFSEMTVFRLRIWICHLLIMWGSFFLLFSYQKIGIPQKFQDGRSKIFQICDDTVNIPWKDFYPQYLKPCSTPFYVRNMLNKVGIWVNLMASREASCSARPLQLNIVKKLRSLQVWQLW